MQFTLCFVILLLVDCLAERRCRMLALESGGTKGAFQAGAFKAMAEFLEPEEVRYDVIAGVSIGSVNGMLLAATQKGKEKEAAQKLSELWGKIELENVIKKFTLLDVMRGFVDKQSFFDNTPFAQYIKRTLEQLGNTIYRKYTIGAVNAHTAKMVIINETVGVEALPKFVMASAAIPAIFPYSIDGDKVLIDGGAIDNVNIRGGIAQCRQIVDDDSSIIVDVVMTNPVSRDKGADIKKFKTFGVFARGRDIVERAKSFRHLKDALMEFPKVAWRFLIAPKEPLPNSPIVALSFDRATLKKEEEIGYNVTKEYIRSGKVGFKEVVEEALNKSKRTRV
eukprot:TRINITY_DN2482_c0_g1_i3.p1 TRINITY_DN2482_c0_g1~~TRINITY_DN2482_c0_g1_i3.p1  ORF type:complete len:336 (-),score=76.83 TRINITY_DN2482_c0_g1_i3:152-1159(-)